MAISFHRVQGEGEEGYLKGEGESLEFISDTLGVNIQELLMLNPELTTGMNSGQIRVPLHVMSRENPPMVDEQNLDLGESKPYETELLREESVKDYTDKVTKETVLNKPVVTAESREDHKSSIIWKAFPAGRV
jgi:hypothetical protein